MPKFDPMGSNRRRGVAALLRDRATLLAPAVHGCHAHDARKRHGDSRISPLLGTGSLEGLRKGNTYIHLTSVLLLLSPPSKQVS